MSVSPSTVPASTKVRARRTPLSVLIAAWAAPLLVVGDFALLAVVPVTIVLVKALRDPRLSSLRWPAAALTAVYATPLAIWLLNPDRPGSLSKDIDPVFVGLIVAASAAVLVTLYARKR